MNPTANQFLPRLSEATNLLPLIRGHLAAAASLFPLATALDLVPIVEDGLFGYELVPDREAHNYPVIGCNAQGAPVLRNTSYGFGTPGALSLVAAHGHLLSRGERAAHYSVQQRDVLFSSWFAAAESALAQFRILCPDPPRQTPILREDVHRWLDMALSFAHSRLARWDPFIEFFGLPDEARLGFALRGAGGEHGELMLQHTDTWALRWNASPGAVHESWSLAPDDLSARGNDLTQADVHFADRRAQNRRAHNRRAHNRRAHNRRGQNSRAHHRRGTDRSIFPDPAAESDRRRLGRRAMDRRIA